MTTVMDGTIVKGRFVEAVCQYTLSETGAVCVSPAVVSDVSDTGTQWEISFRGWKNPKLYTYWTAADGPMVAPVGFCAHAHIKMQFSSTTMRRLWPHKIKNVVPRDMFVQAEIMHSGMLEHAGGERPAASPAPSPVPPPPPAPSPSPSPPPPLVIHAPSPVRATHVPTLTAVAVTPPVPLIAHLVHGPQRVEVVTGTQLAQHRMQVRLALMHDRVDVLELMASDTIYINRLTPWAEFLRRVNAMYTAKISSRMQLMGAFPPVVDQNQNWLAAVHTFFHLQYPTLLTNVCPLCPTPAQQLGHELFKLELVFKPM
jgi:hypothetical protein